MAESGQARSAEQPDHADIAEFYRSLADLIEQDGGLYVINHEVSHGERPHVLAELRGLADTHARQARSAGTTTGPISSI